MLFGFMRLKYLLTMCTQFFPVHAFWNTPQVKPFSTILKMGFEFMVSTTVQVHICSNM